MVTSNQINPGMILSISGKMYRVESSVKVTVRKGAPFIKTKLRDLSSDKVTEKNFQPDQTVEAVSATERALEFLYPEGNSYLFLDITTLDQVLVPNKIVGNKIDYLKEGTEITGSFYGDSVFSVELPQFLELMVSSTDGDEGEEDINLSSAMKEAVLETGAKLEVPPFIEVGDVIKVDTNTNEYIQRV